MKSFFLSLVTVSVLASLPTPSYAASDGLARLPMRGWDSWNWVGVSGCSDACAVEGMDGRCHSEVVLRGMADALKHDFLPAGYDILTASEGWPAQCFRAGTCSGRFPNGTIMHDPDRYPSGMKALADYAHANGLRFGIYLDAGSVTCAGFPGSLGHEQTDVAWLASIGADYLWLDGCHLDSSLMVEKYELWSRLLNESGREIPWEVSWPAYVWHKGPGEQAGADPYNQDLWYHSTAVGHETRMYLDNSPEWDHILDIAAFGHEAQLSKYHRPGSMAFLDMLEVGVAPLTYWESRAHLGLWVLMAQPLHVGMDIRNASAEYVDMFTNPDLLAAAGDPLVKMGSRVRMSDGRLNGTQVWARELSDGSRLVGLLNAAASSGLDPNCTWEQRKGGFFQVDPPDASGNYVCWPAGSDLNAMKEACCGAGTAQCVSVDHNLADGSGCGKRNDNGGWINDTNYEDYVITHGHEQPVPPTTTQICFNWTEVGLNPYQNATVRDVWQRRDLGSFAGGYCYEQVAAHDIALLRVMQ
eukprot:INCI3197.1.p1 GENE.INCI3197.1~~INCI3197.1.p1  ORF type:complete len:526 (+),score=35.14 INCI3197.1:277-1854(+)